jgi:hypothetical protein
MGRRTGDFNRYGHLEDEEAQAQNPHYEGQPVADPLDHDNDGEKGGSKKGKQSTRSRGAAKKAEQPETSTPVEGEGAAEADETATETTDDSQSDTQDEETPADAEETSTGEEVSEEKGE